MNTPDYESGGGGGIRTPGGREPSTVFKTAAIDRSATPPSNKINTLELTALKRNAKLVPDWCPTVHITVQT
jgi:hypothetical protein